ncbi:sensor histidine kinase [Miniphocaeibacter halophilus]|uniref:GHKL domain-containing protein n=1 Tax=Miniphocaeibacter halophilus TaxID=2931922 RepID=A0AC61MV72_9FIRM|nr:GHKL domain-containing protein [Miniphocaeibacter halophilus]QQK08325.1 GHKL domain-containing protein [Miniphocaeibacter halophilus]
MKLIEILKWINNLDLQTIPEILFCFLGILILSKIKFKNLKIKSYIYVFISMFLIVLIRHRLYTLTIPTIALLTLVFSMVFIKNNLIKSFNLTGILILVMVILENLLDIVLTILNYPPPLYNLLNVLMFLIGGTLLLLLISKIEIPYNNKFLAIFLIIATVVYYQLVYRALTTPNFPETPVILDYYDFDKLNLSESDIENIKSYFPEEYFDQEAYEHFQKMSLIKDSLKKVLSVIVMFAFIGIYLHLIVKLEREKFLDSYYDSLEKNYNEVRKFRHDYKNILITLNGLIKQNDLDGIKDFYYSITDEDKEIIFNKSFNLDRLSNIHIKYLKGFLFNKIREAEEKNVDVFLDISDYIENINIKNVDLIRILGIILDNAIEEVESLGQGKVSVVFLTTKTSKIIIVENNSRKNIQKLFELKKEGFSTKGSNRGLGLSILDEILSKYKNITHEIQIENNKFLHKLEIKD